MSHEIAAEIQTDGVPGAWDVALCYEATAQEILWLQVGGDGLSVAYTQADGQVLMQSYDAGWQGILALDRLTLRVSAGTARCHHISPGYFTKMLAFFDEAQKTHQPYDVTQPMIASLIVDTQMLPERRVLELWFQGNLFNPSPEFHVFMALLRRTEGYFLIRFLLSQSEIGGSLREFCTSYGVSYSHFRRLCQQALGGAIKGELRAWRMARSLLDTLDGQQSLTDVALQNGYASSSHFSNEIKGFLGVSPRSLSNILGMVAK